MNQDSLKELVKKGLSAMKAGSAVAERATSEIQNDATNEQLRESLREGNERSQQWAQRIDRALQEAGGQADQSNAILEAHYKVSKEIREQAEDEYSRDLGIIASGQMAIHYWIASFGTIRTYAEQLGLEETARAMESCVEEAKATDKLMTDLAAEIMGGQSQNQTQHSNQSQSASMHLQ